MVKGQNRGNNSIIFTLEIIASIIVIQAFQLRKLNKYEQKESWNYHDTSPY